MTTAPLPAGSRDPDLEFHRAEKEMTALSAARQRADRLVHTQGRHVRRAQNRAAGANPVWYLGMAAMAVLFALVILTLAQ